MRNSKILALNLLLITFSTNAYSHTGSHSDNGLQTTIHFATNLDHLPFIIPAMIILGLVSTTYAILRQITAIIPDIKIDE